MNAKRKDAARELVISVMCTLLLIVMVVYFTVHPPLAVFAGAVGGGGACLGIASASFFVSACKGFTK